jgi:spore coat polysaccharide biosynthesis protein SpsF
MSRTVAIIQARMGASRLPAKMMLYLHGHPVIEWVVRRISAARRLDDVVVAIPDTPLDDVLHDFLSNTLHANVFRGSEQDVLGRFVAAGKAYGADQVVRVCADNPLISGEVIDDLIQFLDDNPCEYAYNQGDSGSTNTYPDGLGAEMVPFSLLEWLDQHAVNPRHREHCLSYIADHADQFHIRTFDPPDNDLAHPELKLDLDTLEDYAHLWRLKVAPSMSAREIVAAALSRGI